MNGTSKVASSFDSMPLPPRRFSLDGEPMSIAELVEVTPDLDVADLHEIAGLQVGELLVLGSITLRREE